MKKLFTILFLASALVSSAQTNVPNGSFENWTNGVPDGWNKVQGRVRNYSSKSYSLNTQSGTVSGTLNANQGTSFLGLLNDSPAVNGSIQLGILRSDNFYLGRKPGEFNVNIVYLTSVNTETFLIRVVGWYDSFGQPDTNLRKSIFINSTGIVSGTPTNGVYPWIGLRSSLTEADYQNITPDSASVTIFPSGLFAQGSTPTTSLTTELLVDNIRFNPYATGTGTTLKASNHNAAYNYPNPAQDYTTFVYQLAVRSNVKLSVYDINGKLVHTDTFNNMESGEHQTVFNTSNLNNGLYIYTIETDYLTESGKLFINK